MQKRLVISVIAAVLAPALVLAQKTSYDFDKTANFAGFKTYAHKEGTKVGQELIDARILAAIDAQMAAKGFTVSESSPDVFVVYHVAFDKQQDISTGTAPAIPAATGVTAGDMAAAGAAARARRRCATS